MGDWAVEWVGVESVIVSPPAPTPHILLQVKSILRAIWKDPVFLKVKWDKRGMFLPFCIDNSRNLGRHGAQGTGLRSSHGVDRQKLRIFKLLLFISSLHLVATLSHGPAWRVVDSQSRCLGKPFKICHAPGADNTS